ncbi:MAG: DinB family protein [Acidobacteria bacterium]|nr:DinB family protein [Acidobacteriota bacterium]
MLNETTTRPDASEYASYYEKYVSLVPEGEIVATLSHQLDETLSTLRGLTEAQANSRYAPGKWSVKELIGHVIDGERIFGHRAFCFARNDQAALPGFEQDDYVRAANFDARQLSDLADEFEHVRRANLFVLRSLDNEAWLRRGTASDNEVSVRALAYIMAGHETHHLRILRERYL